MRAVFRPEAELTLFLRMRIKNRQNIAKMYSDRRVIHLLQEICFDEANGEVRFLTEVPKSPFLRMRGENRPKIAYNVVKSPKF